MGLHRRDQRMADLVIRNDQLLLIGQNSVLLLVSRNDDFYALLKVCLRGKSPAVADGPQGGLIDDIGQLGTGGARRHSRYFVKIDIRAVFDLLGVNFQDIFPALEIRQFHGDPPVEAAGSCQRGIERFGAVCSRQDDDADVLLETVHLREQLVEGLFALVVAAQGGSVTLFADRVDLVDEDDAGCLLLGLFEEVADFGRAHAYEHLHKFRAGHGEEWHIGFACDRLGQHGLSGSGRANEKNAFGHRRADLLIFAGVVQVLHDLLQVFLGLLFARHIRKLNAFRGLDVDLGVALAHSEHQRVRPARLVHHSLVEHISQPGEDSDRQHPGEKEGEQR